jgi:hypothetical protein
VEATTPARRYRVRLPRRYRRIGSSRPIRRSPIRRTDDSPFRTVFIGFASLSKTRNFPFSIRCPSIVHAAEAARRPIGAMGHIIRSDNRAGTAYRRQANVVIFTCVIYLRPYRRIRESLPESDSWVRCPAPTSTRPGRWRSRCAATSMGTGGRLHRRPAHRCHPGVPVPRRRVRQRAASRCHAAGSGLRGLAGAADGDRAHGRPGQRDPRYRVGGTERRCAGRSGRRRLHRPGRAVVGSGQRHVDEPGPVVQPGTGQRPLDQLLGVRGGATGRRADRGRLRLPAAWPRR